MSRKPTPAPYWDYRKKISNPQQLSQLHLLSEQWGMSYSEVCWKLIIDGFQREKTKREEINELRRINSK